MRFLRALLGLCDHNTMIRLRVGRKYIVYCNDCSYKTELIRRVK